MIQFLKLIAFGYLTIKKVATCFAKCHFTILSEKLVSKFPKKCKNYSFPERPPF